MNTEFNDFDTEDYNKFLKYLIEKNDLNTNELESIEDMIKLKNDIERYNKNSELEDNNERHIKKS